MYFTKVSKYIMKKYINEIKQSMGLSAKEPFNQINAGSTDL